MQTPYPKPGPMGGQLTRAMIQLLRKASLRLPLTSHIHCAVSGGVDSTALALLLLKYGRRIVSKDAVSLVHINHGWRGEASDKDEQFVRELALAWGAPFLAFHLDPQTRRKGESWENHARTERKRIFADLQKQGSSAMIMTAHHGDDLAETLLWRLFTGQADTHGGGILVKNNQELRPLLGIRKRDLKAFLEEEGQTWREDRTNRDGRFLRAQMRLEVVPPLEKLFPQAMAHLIRTGLNAQLDHREFKKKSTVPFDLGELFFKLNKGRVRKVHWQEIEKLQSKAKAELHLPGGWKLTRGF